MNHLTIPFIFLLYVITGWVLADPQEPYTAFDYETMETVYVEPQSDESVIIYDENMDASFEIIVDETPDEVWVVDPNTADITVYVPD